MSGDYLQELFGVSGKVVAITGGGGYLCSHIAKGYAKAGMQVAILDLRQEKAEAVAQAVRDEGGTAMALQCDATVRGDWEKALAAVLERFGTVDVLLNGAGCNAPTPILEIEEEEWLTIMKTNVLATLLGCQVFGGHMLSLGKGAIVNFSSASSGPPLSKAFTYSAAKSGVLSLTKNVAREWATRGVRVNAIRPGFFPTDWSKEHFITEAREQAILGHTPMGRYGHPDELIGAMLWLVSDAASFVTGAEIAVDGGFSAMTI